MRSSYKALCLYRPTCTKGKRRMLWFLLTVMLLIFILRNSCKVNQNQTMQKDFGEPVRINQCQPLNVELLTQSLWLIVCRCCWRVTIMEAMPQMRRSWRAVQVSNQTRTKAVSENRSEHLHVWVPLIHLLQWMLQFNQQHKHLIWSMNSQWGHLSLTAKNTHKINHLLYIPFCVALKLGEAWAQRQGRCWCDLKVAGFDRPAFISCKDKKGFYYEISFCCSRYTELILIQLWVKAPRRQEVWTKTFDLITL